MSYDEEVYDKEVSENFEDVYDSDELTEDDGVSTQEDAFMRGYREAGKKEEDDEE